MYTQHTNFLGAKSKILGVAKVNREKYDAVTIYLGQSSYTTPKQQPQLCEVPGTNIVQ